MTVGSPLVPGDSSGPSTDRAAESAVRGGSVWLAIAFMAAGLLVSLGGIVLAVLAVAQASRPANPALLGQAAVLAIVVGGGSICVGIGILLFGWAGGSPRLGIGSHRSVVATTLLALVMGVLLGVGYLRLTGNARGNPGEVLSTLGGAVYGMLLVMVYVQGIRTRLITRDSLGLRLGQILPGLAAGVVAAIAITLFSAVNGLVLQALGVEQPQAGSFSWLRGKPLSEYTVSEVLVILTVVVVAPIVEELFFRGYVFSAYLRAKGPVVAYLAGSGLFSLMHVYPQLLLAIFGMGFMLAFTYRRSGTIVAPITAHVMNNAIAFVALVAAGAQQ